MGNACAGYYVCGTRRVLAGAARAIGGRLRAGVPFRKPLLDSAIGQPLGKEFLGPFGSLAGFVS